MIFDVNRIPPRRVREEIFAELYMITYGTIPNSASLDEVVLPKPGAAMKPTKRSLEPCATSTGVSEPVQKALCDPIIETSAETCKTVDKSKAIPESTTAKKGKARENSRNWYPFKENYTSSAMKPTKRSLESCATSTEVPETVQKGLRVYYIETSAETCSTVDKSKAIPESTTAKKGMARENSRHCYPFKANYTSLGMKPTKRSLESCATSTEVSEPVQKALCVSHIETSAETCGTVDKSKAIPESTTAKKGMARENSRHCYPSKANYTSLAMKPTKRSSESCATSTEVPETVQKGLRVYYIETSAETCGTVDKPKSHSRVHPRAKKGMARENSRHCYPSKANYTSLAMKPTKRFSESCATSTEVSEPVQKAVCVPLIETSVETCGTVDKPKAVPKSTTAKKGNASRQWYPSTANYTSSEMADFLFAQYLVKSDLHLRSSCKENSRYSDKTCDKTCKNSTIKSKDTCAGSTDQNSTPSAEIPSEVGEKKDEKKIKKPKQMPANIKKEKEEEEDPFSGSCADKIYILSPELTGVIGQKEASPDTVLKAMDFLMLEGSLQAEPGKEYMKCDDELSEKLFGEFE
ncbi:hypothetical protein HNY73_006371 [Argiope bruennichi]|uniref:Uncharacterized protein n=1 Tax=Argiope bruennichi TaxID=94029 RepID=A0A8T0FPG7_ARGBR|nr:hypothetical protein HNY73_006371 [Argiope bruennichi]